MHVFGVWQLCCRLYADRSAKLCLRFWLRGSSSQEQAVGSAMVAAFVTPRTAGVRKFWHLLAELCSAGKLPVIHMHVFVCKALQQGDGQSFANSVMLLFRPCCCHV
jgi:hypothetical protein